MIYYGESIRRQSRELLAQLGIEHGLLRIVDEGALPFVISARIEAAVKRAGLMVNRQSLPPAVPLPKVSAKDRLRRSRPIFPEMSPSTLSMPACMGPLPSFSTWKIPFIPPRRAPRAFWCETRSVQSISSERSAWYASISYRLA